MSDIKLINRRADDEFGAAHLRWTGQNINHLPLPRAVVQSMHDSIDSAEF